MSDIVIMPPNWLGDVVMAQPAMRALSTHFKDDRIFVFGRPWLAELLPYLNLEHHQVQYVPEIPQYADRAFLFPNSLRSAWQSFRSHAKQRVGFRREGRGILLSHAYTSRIDMMKEHHISYYLDLIQQYGLETPYQKVELASPAFADGVAMELLLQHGIDPERYICVAPGAQFGGAKRYPAQSYAAILSQLSQQGWDIVILGTAAESEIAASCVADVQGSYWNAAGDTSLSQALALVAKSRLMLCNDSGLMHVAAGLAVPTVTMFGATDPDRTSPSGRFVHVLYEPAACSPCLQRECTVAGHPCMANITPDMVTGICLEMLA